MNLILLLFIALVSSYIGTYIVRVYAIKKSIIDIPNQRSSHKVPTPRGGGLAIVSVWYFFLVYLFFAGNLDKDIFYALLSGSLLAVISLLDDIYNLSPKIRLLTQAISVCLAIYFIGPLIKVDLGFYVINGSLILIPFIFIGLIWFINLYNFLDGIDGYAASQAIFISLVFYFLTRDELQLYLIAVTVGFLIWNWHSAKIFMGDVGSTVLGFTFGIFTLYYAHTYKISIFTLLIPSALFWFDATFTLYRRWRNKEQLSEAHKKHAYQRIVQSGFSHSKTVMYSILINLFLFALTALSHFYSKLSVLFFIIAIISLYTLNRIVDKRKSF